MNFFAKTLSVSAMVAGAIFAQTVPNSTISEPAPIGISASTSGVLFSQPFCDNQTTINGTTVARGVYTVGGTSPTVPLPTSPSCTENYFAVSTGLGGFTANTAYIAGLTSSGTPVIFEAPLSGGPLTVFSPLPVAGTSSPHTALTFDTVGTFGFGLIATGSNGIEVLNSSGSVIATYPNPANGTALLEGATVAPLSYTQCPGCLFIVSESLNGGSSGIYVVPAGSPSGTVPMFFATGPAEAEGIVFVPPTPCTFAGNAYYVSGFSKPPSTGAFSTGGAILGYTSQQIAPYSGQFLVPDEGTGIIWAYSGPDTSGTVNRTVFSNTGYQLEGSTAVSCPVSTTTSGFMTGGGQTANFAASHGMELGCTANSNHHNLEVNWAGGNQFHLSSISTVTCYLDPSLPAPAPPQASFNTLVLTGTGTYDGHSGATVSAVFTDAGEPGTNDMAEIVVTYNGQTVLDVPLAKIATGNQQAHR